MRTRLLQRIHQNYRLPSSLILRNFTPERWVAPRWKRRVMRLIRGPVGGIRFSEPSEKPAGRLPSLAKPDNVIPTVKKRETNRRGVADQGRTAGRPACGARHS